MTGCTSADTNHDRVWSTFASICISQPRLFPLHTSVLPVPRVPWEVQQALVTAHTVLLVETVTEVIASTARRSRPHPATTSPVSAVLAAAQARPLLEHSIASG